MTGRTDHLGGHDKHPLVPEGGILIVEDLLHCNDVGLSGIVKISSRSLLWEKKVLTAYADCAPTFAMIVTMTCSLMVNGPGLREIPKILTWGTKRAYTLMRGNESSWATIYRREIRWRCKARILGTYTSDGYAGVTEEEELVQTGDEDCPDEAEDPCTGGLAGHVGVVGISDGGPNFGIRRVILCKAK